MRIDNARRVRDLAQEVVHLIDAATARARRDREETNEHYRSAGLDPLTAPESSALRRRSMDLTRALAEMRKP